MLDTTAALVVTVGYWFFPPQSPASFLAIRIAYMFTKTLFVTLLVCGASAFAGVGIIRWRRSLIAAASAPAGSCSERPRILVASPL